MCHKQSMSFNRKPGRPKHNDVLTPAEWRTVEAVRHGLTNPEIARAHKITLDAVKYHVANALSKLDFKSRKDLQKWKGVDQETSLYRKEPAMDPSITLEKIGQIARNVSDIDAATTWYRDVLGLSHLYSFGNLSFFDCLGTRLFLSQGDGKPEHNSIIYFKVDDIREAHNTLSEKGISFPHAPHKIHVHEDGTEEWMAFMEDPDGQPIGLMGNYSSQNL